MTAPPLLESLDQGRSVLFHPTDGEELSSSPAVELQKPRLPPLPGLLRFKKGLKCEPAETWLSRRQDTGPKRWQSSAAPRVLGCGRSPSATATPPPSARNVAVVVVPREALYARWLEGLSAEECAAGEICPRQSGEERSSRL